MCTGLFPGAARGPVSGESSAWLVNVCQQGRQGPSSPTPALSRTAGLGLSPAGPAPVVSLGHGQHCVRPRFTHGGMALRKLLRSPPCVSLPPVTREPPRGRSLRLPRSVSAVPSTGHWMMTGRKLSPLCPRAWHRAAWSLRAAEVLAAEDACGGGGVGTGLSSCVPPGGPDGVEPTGGQKSRPGAWEGLSSLSA